MKEKQKDLIIFFITSLGSSYCSIWAVLYPYYCSFIHHKNNFMTMSIFYYTSTTLLIGIPIGGLLTPYIINVLGLKSLFLFLTISYIIIIYGVLNFSGITSNLILSTGFGMQYSINETATNMFLSLKYKDGIGSLKYIASFKRIIIISFAFLAQLAINYDNEYPLLDSQTNEKYFSQKIGYNFKNFMIGLIIISALFFYSGYHYLEDPQGIQNNFMKWINSIYKGTEFINQIDEKEIQECISSSEISLSSQKKNLIEDKEQKLLNQNQDNFKVEQSAIILLLTILIVTIIQFIFCTNNFKYVGLIIGFSDYTLTFTQMFTEISFILANFFVCYIWDNYKFSMSLFFYIFFISIGLILTIISQFYKWTFLLSVQFARFQLSYHIMFVNLVLYNLFPPKQGIYYAKYFYGTSAIAGLISNFINSFIFNTQNYIQIYYVFALLNILDYFLVYYFLKNYEFNKHKKK